MFPLHRLARPSFLVAFGATCAASWAFSSDTPRAWEPDAFLPVTEARIAALPAAEQPAWRAYWAESVARSQRFTNPRDLVDHSSTDRLEGPPIGASYSRGLQLHAPREWYASEDARLIADHVATWQTVAGGWVKTGDYTRDRRPDDDHHDAWSAGTFDNDSTIYELRFLALVRAAADDSLAARARAWREALDRGLDYTFAAQYPNGGFPQIYPLVGWYHDAITFNDDAMVHILELCRDIGTGQGEWSFVPEATREEARRRYARGIACVLATQLRGADGRRTIWGQQHDPLTLEPCAARNFEPVAATSRESTGLVEFLMTIPAPSSEIIAAVDGAMTWFERRALHDVVWNRTATEGTGLEAREGAPDLWARFYDIESGRPIFGERDRRIHFRVTELTNERRLGYGWYNNRPAELRVPYAAWRERLAGTSKP